MSWINAEFFLVLWMKQFSVFDQSATLIPANPAPKVPVLSGSKKKKKKNLSRDFMGVKTTSFRSWWKRSFSNSDAEYILRCQPS